MTVTWAAVGPQDAFITASVTNKNGDPQSNGGWLTVSNADKKHSVYLGLSGVANLEVGPGATKMFDLVIYRTKNDTGATKQPVVFRYCNPFE
jgi:hypothetical protein